MKKFARDLMELVRPFGLKRLAFVVVFILVQAVMQLLAVFSLVPFLTAAADIGEFKNSRLGEWFIYLIGGGSDRQIIINTGIISIALILFSNVSNLSAEYARGRYAYQLGHWLRMRLLKRLLDRRYEYFLSINSTALLKNMIEDITSFSVNVVSPMLDILARSCLILLLGIFTFILEPKILLASMVIVGVYSLIIIRPIRWRATRTAEASMVHMRSLYMQIYQVLSGIKPILGTGRHQFFVDRCNDASAAYSREMPRIPIYSAIPRSGLEVLVFGGLILWILLTLISGGDLVLIMPRIGLIAIVAYRLMPSLQLLLAQAMAVTSARPAMDEVLKLFREQASKSIRGEYLDEPQSEPKPLEWHHSLHFEKVSFGYVGTDQVVLHDINFTIAKGERVAFVGPTGSGKSTLIDLLLGLLFPTEGRISIDGQELTPMVARQWHYTVGYVPQELFLSDGTIGENIAFGENAEELNLARVRQSAELAQALEFIEHKDLGLGSKVGERGVRLSGGQRQRLALARALYSNPNVLILDEATSALDPRTEQKVIANLALERDDELTVISVTHRLNTIRDYDRIYFIKDGRILASGTYDQLQQQPMFAEFSR